MAIVLMALLFEERLRHSVMGPMLSSADIEKVLKHYLPRRDATEQELFRLLQASHDRRKQPTIVHRRRSSPI
jgi:hypothetical protein